MAVKTRHEWPSAAESKENAFKMRARLEDEVRQYEKHFGFDSSELAERLRCGYQEETFAVSRWLIALDALKSLSGGR